MTAALGLLLVLAAGVLAGWVCCSGWRERRSEPVTVDLRDVREGVRR